MTLKEIILKVLRERENDWVAGFDLEKVNTRWGWLGTSSGRRCRELYEAGKIDRKIDGKYVFYKAKPIIYEHYKVKLANNEIKQLSFKVN